MSKTIPENCNECEHTKGCKSAYYGGLGCHHEKAIYEKTMGKMNMKIDENDKEDVVKEPSHYKHGRFETIDEMIIVFGPQRTYDYCIIAAWKYRARAPFKGNPEQDMRKADEYLELAKKIADANPTVSQITLIKEKE